MSQHFNARFAAAEEANKDEGGGMKKKNVAKN